MSLLIDQDMSVFLGWIPRLLACLQGAHFAATCTPRNGHWTLKVAHCGDRKLILKKTVGERD